MSEKKPETREFQAEVKQVLDIVVHSLYTDREVFIRELVSNASDALEKLRHLQLTEKNVFDDSLEPEINVTTDEEAGTITIQDFGIGMNEAELVENLGTIAHSGSKAFLKAIKEGGSKNENLIGQFGVGFYSAFMVADEVLVYTHSWKPDEKGYCWKSDGSGVYEIEEADGQRRGAKIVVKLKEDQKEFSKSDRVKSVLENYSAFVPFPLNLNGEKINTVGALWLKSASEVTEEEYKEFYKFQANAFDEPRFWLHFSADAPLEINSLLFAPQQNMEQFGIGRMEPGVSLYCRKVLIDRHPEGLLPEWMRFVRGVVDSADLPLNISRESMQDSSIVRKLSKVLTRRFLKMLGEKDKKDPDAFRDFYQNFSQYLKEGVVSDASNRESIAKLLRYESSRTEAGKITSLADYVTRMSADQKDIYYLFGSSRQSIASGPYLEAFESRGLEVLFVTDPIDEFVMSHLGEFDGKKLVSADRQDVELPDAPESEGEALSQEEGDELSKWVKEKLGERVNDVVISKRLTESPAVVLNSDASMTPQMRRMMKAMNQDGGNMPESPVRFELNAKHPLIKSIASLKSTDQDLAASVAEQVFSGARLSAGLEDDSSKVVKGMNEILGKLLNR
ncbi:molecular chaperone HtpG [Puniceicoccus vermicola]|uniref:Chaperone protein HtpG n=1 Tax=Puniceicoccus vermicola TaxID=388746 RepID=A0A7X1AYH9_9BACT|nr:molecular chaperone HtpG [Puniceicoccus vermicola]MBC2602109.1 molecular chaperone HtpG [Puniceicoccus vermicola]